MHKNKWFGIDISNEENIENYGLIAKEVESNVYKFIYYDTLTQSFQMCTMCTPDILNCYSDLSDENKQSLLSFIGISEEEFLSGNIVQIISDLLQCVLTVYDIFGHSYSNGMTLEEVYKYIKSN